MNFLFFPIPVDFLCFLLTHISSSYMRGLYNCSFESRGWQLTWSTNSANYTAIIVTMVLPLHALAQLVFNNGSKYKVTTSLENLSFKCNLLCQLDICSMKLYYNLPIFGKDALTSKNAVAVGGKNTATNLEPVDSIFTISFLQRIIQFNVLDLLLLGDIHCICHMTFH